jgi:hypothetical protein
MTRLLIVGLVAGTAFLVTDGILHANPLARRLYAVYRPIARPSVNSLAGSVVDLVYGVVLTALFAILRQRLPGETGLEKAMSFGAMVWFLRVGMRVAGEWVTTTVPAPTHAYTLVAGLVQILLVSIIIAVLLPDAR